jgi:hypothetical protein
MKKFSILVVVLSALAVISTKCSHKAGGSSTERSEGQSYVPQATSTPNQPKSEPEIEIRDSLVKNDELSYNGFVVQKRRKRVKIDGGPRSPITAEASYVVLQRNGKTVMKFDGIYHPMGNGAEFGLFSLFGGDAKQLIVSLDVFRAGRQWVVDLNESARVIYDGNMWETGRETDDLGIIDLDRDGLYEITTPITDFYELNDKMSMSEIPLPVIVFKYDERKRTHQPANTNFPAYTLGNISSDNERANDSPESARSEPIRILLDYVYAGKEKEGWALYDSRYRLSDKEEMRNRINSILRREPVYKFIYYLRSK